MTRSFVFLLYIIGGCILLQGTLSKSHAEKSSWSLQNLMTLKRVGFTEQQLLLELKKAGKLGKTRS